MPKTYDPIATTTLGSAAASYTFSSIPATYTDLIVIVNGGATGAADMGIRFNGDTATNYSRTVLSGNGTSATSSRISSADFFRPTNTGNLNNTLNFNAIINIFNYTNTTTFKTILSRTNNAGTGTDATVGLWRKTPEAITSVLLLTTDSQSFSTGTTFTLYGIKAA
jgi:hypothetical protein